MGAAESWFSLVLLMFTNVEMGFRFLLRFTRFTYSNNPIMENRAMRV